MNDTEKVEPWMIWMCGKDGIWKDPMDPDGLFSRQLFLKHWIDTCKCASCLNGPNCPNCPNCLSYINQYTVRELGTWVMDPIADQS